MRKLNDHKEGRWKQIDVVEISIIARACCDTILFVHVCVRTRVQAKRISMPQTVGQLLVLRRRASENHKLWRSEVTGYGDGLGVVRVPGSGKGMSPIRMQDASAFKVVARLPDIPLRNHVMRDFYCFLPSLSFRINDVSIFRQTTSDSWLSLGSKIFPRGSRIQISIRHEHFIDTNL